MWNIFYFLNVLYKMYFNFKFFSIEYILIFLVELLRSPSILCRATRGALCSDGKRERKRARKGRHGPNKGD